MSVVRRRLPVLGLGAVSLVCGLAAGLGRAGWDVPAAGLALVHGPLMISAFFGTVIGLERAVATRRWWAFAAPLACGAGGVALLAGLPLAAAILILLGSAVFTAVMARAVWGHWGAHLLVLTGGAVAWLAGNAAWAAGADVYRVVIPWASFLLLTIFGERMELGRFGPPAQWKSESAVAIALAVTVTAALALVIPEAAWLAFGAVLLAAAAWLLRFDIARRTIRQPGLPRFIAACLLSGYGWLAVAGAWALGASVEPAGFAYDAVLHALFVGFVFSMIFGHAPVILPAVLGIRLHFTRLGYGALVLLHASVGVRLGGDFLQSVDLRAIGAAANVGALALWVAMNVAGTLWRPSGK